LILGLGCAAPTAFASYQTINNDSWWLTTSGTPIYAQSGYIAKIGNTYYWWGVEYNSAVNYEKNGTVGGLTFVAVNCYTSTDLAHWTFQSQALTPTGANITSGSTYIGRLGAVLYNATSNLWVMWIVYQDAVNGTGEMCATSSSPMGPFTYNHVQTTIPNVYDSTNGDCTIFVDTANGGTPYFITSDAHGREHAYVCPLSSDYLTIGAATLISEWPQGQEANDMFERNGRYYYCMSNLAGWSFSSAYQVNSPSILTPSDYTGDAAFAGTTVNDTYYSQITFALPVVGNNATTYIMVCDRWSNLDSTYASAGHGTGYEVWEPLTWNGTTPTFLPMSSYQLDAVTGNWRALPAFAAPTGLTATPGPGNVTLNWDASGNATSYTVRRATASGGPYTIIASNLTLTTYTDTAVTNGTIYYYEVAAVNGATTSSNTLTVSAIPSTNAAPAAPGELAVTTGNAQVTLSWDASGGATSYLVQRSSASAGPYTTIASGVTGTTYTDTTASNGVTYYYEVAATNGTTTSTNSPPVSAIPSIPPVIGNVTWTGTASSAWDNTTANWFNGTIATLYLDGDTVAFTDTAANSSITISNPVNPAAIIFSNSATNYTVGGASISGATSVILNGSGTVSFTSANAYSGGTVINAGTLNFNPAGTTNAGTGVISLAGGALLITGTASSPNTIVANAVNVTSNSSLAYSSGGNNQTQFTGNFSGTGTLFVNIPTGDIMNVGGVAGQFSGFTGTLEFGTSTGQLKVRTASDLNFGNATVDLGSGSFSILSKESGVGNTSQTFGAITGGTGTKLAGPDASGATFTYNVGNLNTNAEFDGAIANGSGPVAINKIGGGTWTLTGSNTYSGGTTVIAGTLLLNNTNGSATGSGAVTIAAGGTLGGTGGLTGNVTVQSGGGLLLNSSGNPAVTGNVTLSGTVVVTAAANLSVGNYNLLSYNGTLSGSPAFTYVPPSGTSQAATFSMATPGVITVTVFGPPAAPTGLVATPGSGNVTLNWTASSGATGYTVQRSTISGSSYTTLATNVSATTYKDTTVTNGTTYYYVVVATNAGGSSSASTQSGTTPQPPAPAMPTGLTATAGNGNVTLNWTAVSGATSYTVQRSTTSGAGYSVVNGSVATNTYTDLGLTNGTTYYYVVAAGNSGGLSPNSAEVTATPAQTLAQWAGTAFPGVTDPAIIGPTANPSGDGIPNLLKYFYGLDPAATASSPPLTSVPDNSGNLILTFRLSKNLSGVTYQIQSSPDLMNWTYTGIQGTILSDQSTYYLMQASVPLGLNPRLYLKLSVTGQ